MNSSENSLGLLKRLPIPRRDAGGSFQVFCLLSPPNVDLISLTSYTLKRQSASTLFATQSALR
jgi:hypothetical protein